MEHEIKSPRNEFVRFEEGTKTFVVAEHEIGFQTGDVVKFREWDKTPQNVTDETSQKGYTDSKAIEFNIGYIQVLDHKRVILSLLKPNKRRN